MNTNNEDDFFDALAGRKQADSMEGRMGQSLRTLVAEAREQPDMLSPEEEAARDRLLENLRRKGLLKRESAATSPVMPQANRPTQPPGGQAWHDRLKRWLFEGSWARPVVFASVVLMAGVLSLQIFMPSPQDADDVVRGGPELTFKVSDVAATAERLEKELDALGAQAVATRLNETTWSVVVLTPDESSRARAQAYLAGQGLPVPLAGQETTFRLQQP